MSSEMRVLTGARAVAHVPVVFDTTAPTDAIRMALTSALDLGRLKTIRQCGLSEIEIKNSDVIGKI